MAGFTPLASVEIMPQAVETYEYNFIHKKGFKEKVHTRDIREESVKQELVDAVKDKNHHRYGRNDNPYHRLCIRYRIKAVCINQKIQAGSVYQNHKHQKNHFNRGKDMLTLLVVGTADEH